VISRDLGRHDAEIESLQRENAELRVEVRAISRMLSEARGGWRSLMLVGGAASAAGAFIFKVLSGWNQT
jgi:putative NADH-flavin reductase